MLNLWVDFAALGIEILAIAIMVVFILFGTVMALIRYTRKDAGAYAWYRHVLARTVQIGLELLVAADIVRTVSTPLSPLNLVLLGGLVVVRTFLSWSLSVEIEGCWPWKKWQRQRSPTTGRMTKTAAE